MSIETLARELIDLQQKSKLLLEADDIDAWGKALFLEFRAAEQLRAYLLSHPVIVTDDPAVKQVLVGIDPTEIENLDKIGSELLFSQIEPSEYAAALAQVDVLITPFKVPRNLHSFLEESRQCYALGLYAGVQSLSRTILEAAINDIGVRTRKFRREAFEEREGKKGGKTAKQRIRIVAGDHFDCIYAHYQDLCKVVHGLTTTATCGSLGALTKTIGFVQLLYGKHEHEIDKNEE